MLRSSNGVTIVPSSLASPSLDRRKSRRLGCSCSPQCCCTVMSRALFDGKRSERCCFGLDGSPEQQKNMLNRDTQPLLDLPTLDSHTPPPPNGSVAFPSRATQIRICCQLTSSGRHERTREGKRPRSRKALCIWKAASRLGRQHGDTFATLPTRQILKSHKESQGMIQAALTPVPIDLGLSLTGFWT